jgi:DNA-binding NarL/FixJ family response regulator
MPALRILVADDHEIVRRGICALLKSHAGWDVCTEAADGREAVESAKQLDPDVVILDIGMPNVNGLTAARQILQNDPQQKILFLTITDSEQIVRQVLQAGARGFVLKSDAARDLLTAVEALEKDRTFFTRRVSEMILEGYLNGEAQKELTEPCVSPREGVQLLAEGKSTKEVAFILDLSIKTVETHRSNVMRKLGIHSVSELVLYAVRNNIVQVQLAPE